VELRVLTGLAVTRYRAHSPCCPAGGVHTQYTLATATLYLSLPRRSATKCVTLAPKAWHTPPPSHPIRLHARAINTPKRHKHAMRPTPPSPQATTARTAAYLVLSARAARSRSTSKAKTASDRNVSYTGASIVAGGSAR
jgi:hypothetical protein